MGHYKWITYKGYRLRAPGSFLEWEKEHDCGCGPGDMGNRLVPDSIFKVVITPACCVHDYSYGIGETEEEKLMQTLSYSETGFVLSSKNHGIELCLF